MTTTKWLALAGFTVMVECGRAQNYWVIETNPRQARTTAIRFYNGQNQLIGDEVLEGKTLDVRHRSDRKWLDRRLKDFTRQQKALTSKKEAIKSRKG